MADLRLVWCCYWLPTSGLAIGTTMIVAHMATDYFTEPEFSLQAASLLTS